MDTVLITGGSGLVGRALTRALQAEGHAVRWLGRGGEQAPGVEAFRWDITTGAVDELALDGVDHVVHLSGAGIADKRWSEARKQELYDSRVKAANILRHAASKAGARVRTFVSASAVGLYGAVTSAHVHDEDDPPGSDFIAGLTMAWEAAADAWMPMCRVVKVRTATVLAGAGGALPRLATPVRWGLGASLGRGDQWMPWVHLDDLVRVYLRMITDPALHGAYHVAAPQHITNRELMRTVAEVLRKPFFLPSVPALALRIALGEMSAVLLEGSRISSAKLEATGFAFKHPRLREAVEASLSKDR